MTKKVLKWSGLALLALLLISGLLLFWVTQTETGLRFALRQAEPSLTVAGIDGRLNHLQLGDVTITTEAAVIRIDTLSMDWQLSSLLAGKIQIDRLSASGIEVTVLDVPQDPNAEPWRGTRVPVDVIVNALLLREIAINDTARQTQNISQIEAQVKIVNSELHIDAFEAAMPNAKLQLLGRLGLRARDQDVVSLRPRLGLEFPERKQAMRLNLELDGTWQTLALKSNLQLNPGRQELPGAELSLDGQISHLLSPHPQATLKGNWRLPLALLQATKSAATELEQIGHFELSGQPSDYRFSLQARTTHSQSDGLALKARGSGNLQNLEVNQFDLRPPANLTSGEYFSGRARLEWKDAVSWQLEGNLAQFNPAQLLGDGFSNLSDVSGQFSTQGRFRSQAKNLLGVVGYVQLSEFRAKWQGSPLTADAEVQFQDDGIELRKMQINGASLALQASGELDQEWSINWSAKADDLAEWTTDWRGSLHAQGRVQGALKQPVVTANLKANQLTIPGAEASTTQIASLIGEINLGWFADGPFLIDTRLDGLQQGEQLALQSVKLSSRGTVQDHQLNLSVTGDEQQHLQTELHGGLGGFQDRQPLAWSGAVEHVLFSRPQNPDWRLRAPASLSLALNTIRVEPICLQAAEQSVCVNANIDLRTQSQQAGIKVRQLELAQFEGLLQPQDIKLAGRVNAEIDFQQTASQPQPLITASFIGDGVQLGLPISQQLEGELGENRSPASTDGITEREWLALSVATIELNQAEALRGELQVQLDDGHFLRGSLRSSQALTRYNFSTAPVAGEFELQWSDLSRLPPGLLAGTQLNGRAQSQLKIQGTLGRPQLALRSELSHARLFLPATGVQYSNISLVATSAGESNIAIDGQLTAGEGDLTISGTLDLADLNAAEAQIKLKGQRLALLQTPDIEAIGDLDLNLVLDQQVTDLRGDIVIDQANLSLGAQDNVVLASDDVVLLGEEEQAVNSRQRLQLNIDLGDKTRLTAAGLRAELRGHLNLTQEPGELMIGQGQIDALNGVYYAYGEELELSRGKLVFAGSRVENPLLDLEAVRQLDDLTAGVRVQGTAEAPRLTLFSNPARSDQDVLSLLVFGKPVSDLAGEDSLTLLRIAASLSGGGPDRFTRMTNQLQSALGLTELELRMAQNSPELVAGKQITSRFYVGYGYGLLDAAQSLVLRFRINDAWSIQGDFGANNGADIRYQIER